MLYFGVAFLAGQFIWPFKDLWVNVWHMVYESLVASAAAAFVGIFIFPSLASSDMEQAFGEVIHGVGQAVQG